MSEPVEQSAAGIAPARKTGPHRRCVHVFRTVHALTTWLIAARLLPARLPLRQLELYRDTRDSITLATQNPNCLRDMSPAARDRALQREMRAEGNLHPALQTPDGHYKVCRVAGACRARRPHSGRCLLGC